MVFDNKLWIASTENDKILLLPEMANRHGLIAGATGTGKTVTMKVLAESFSSMGVPVFLSDIKGDITGMCVPGNDTPDMQNRIKNFGIEDFEYKGCPSRFWDIYGEMGLPARVTVSEMGPTLLTKLLGLTEIQEGVLNIVFRAADDAGLLLIDLKDLRAMLKYVGDNRNEYTLKYGNVSAASIGAIQRALLTLENESGSEMFGEPSLDIFDWMKTDETGRGYINILNAVKLGMNPKAYSAFMLWMLTELYEKLPEVGDLPKPKMIFFFDEAHMLFSETSKALVSKIEQVVKLVRSKGVGVYFVTQSPSDIPDSVLAQLSNRVQHGLRAYTPTELKAVKTAAKAFRPNPEFDAETALQELGTGEALISFLDKKGIPSIVEKAKILPPECLMAKANDEIVKKLIVSDEFEEKYRTFVDRESAYEIILAAEQKLAEEKDAEKKEEKEEKKKNKNAEKSKKKTSKTSGIEKTAKKAAKSAANSVARQVSTNVVNSISGGKKKSFAQIAKQAATTALSSVLTSGTNSIFRGLFGTKKK